MPTATEPAQDITSRIKFPKKVRCLIARLLNQDDPEIRKESALDTIVLYGGRNGLKSWQIARALLLLGNRFTLRILCTREVQKSLKDSVHALLKDQIESLELGDVYHVYDTSESGIVNHQTGTTFIFAGLSDQTATSIKSYEGIDICWVEEAQTVKKKSWQILIPTIRKPGSQIWVSFNPELETDDTYERFILNTPPNCKVIFLTYRDNPWFSDKQELVRQHDQKTLSKEEYENIWEGKCLTSVSGAVFAEEVATMVRENRIGILPYDPRLKAHIVLDMGYNTDAMAVGIWQKGPQGEIRSIWYREYLRETVDKVFSDITMLRMNWGKVWLPWDAWVESRQTGKCDADLIRLAGFAVAKVPRVQHEAEGVRIRTLRNCFFRIYMDATEKSGGKRLLECFKRYRRHIPKDRDPARPVHDEFSHGVDMAGYMSQVESLFSNESDRPAFQGGPQPQRASLA